MNAWFLLKKADLVKYLHELKKKGFAVQVPVKEETGSTHFTELDTRELFLETRTIYSAKKFFLPPKEELLNFTLKGRRKIYIEEKKSGGKRVLFGLRVCDLHAVQRLNRFLSEAPKDEFYENKRKRNYLIGLNCIASCETGFCKSLGTSDPTGFDLFFWEKGKVYYVEVGSDKGLELVSKNFFKKTPSKKFSQNFKQKIKINQKNLSQKLLKNFSHKHWNKIGDKCVSCGACTLLCPTCFCYELSDEFIESNTKAKRFREESSCQFSAYSRIPAVGETPRPTEKDRQRHRVLCKFPYFEERFNEFSCVGCGRCSEACIAGIKLHETLKEVAKA